MNRTAKLTIGVLGAIVLVLGGVAAYAAIPSATGVFTACVQKSSGAVRIIDPSKMSCSSTEQTVTWNQAGQPGTPGTNGTNGAPGTNGTNGEPGTPGTNGVSGYVVESRHDQSADTIGGSSLFSTAINCPSGKVPVGGGGIGSSTDAVTHIVLAESTPDGVPGDYHGWRVGFSPINLATLNKFPNGSVVTYDIYAICVTAN